MSKSNDEKPKERPHGHRDRGKTDEGPHKNHIDSSTRDDAPESGNPEEDGATSYPKGR